MANQRNTRQRAAVGELLERTSEFRTASQIHDDLRHAGEDVGLTTVYRTLQLMVEAAASTEGVLADPSPEAFPIGIDAYQNTIRLRWWTKPDRASVIHTQGRVILAAFKALNGAGIDMPYPTQVHLWHDQTEDTDGDRKRQREGWPAGRGDVPRSRFDAAKEASRENQSSRSD